MKIKTLILLSTIPLLMTLNGCIMLDVFVDQEEAYEELSCDEGYNLGTNEWGVNCEAKARKEFRDYTFERDKYKGEQEENEDLYP